MMTMLLRRPQPELAREQAIQEALSEPEIAVDDFDNPTSERIAASI